MSYRVFLQNQFNERVYRNPRYSLRAFARDLRISPSTLSEVLSRKTGLSLGKAKAIASALKLGREEADYFCALVESEVGRVPFRRAKALEKLQAYERRFQYHKISEDKFQFIADWFHLAILEATRIPGFTRTVESVARRLRLTAATARDALDRLTRLNLLQETDEGWRIPYRHGAIPGGDLSQAALREYYRQLSDKAKDAFITQDKEQREVGSVVLAIPKHKMPEAKQMIREFLRQFDQKMQEDGDFDALYALYVQFFRVDGEPDGPRE